MNPDYKGYFKFIKVQSIFIINDIFDSFTEYINLLEKMLQNKDNIKIILFNLPGSY